MGIIRPATPGFLVTLIATILLAVVSFCVPYFKSVYFLKANISIDNINGSITFGTLGYCLELANGTTCSKPSVGYELDINALVGNNLPIEIPQVAVKWLTTALVLHIVALGLAAGSAVFGLLAHVREMSMTCCSSCVAGLAAAVALLAFIFDLALFFVAKSRINKVGSAEIGNAVWLTLAAWLLLFFSGCFYTIGRCCVSKRSQRGGGGGGWGRAKDNEHGGHDDRIRLDAVKAEADRKAKQNATEIGLPAFFETQPLTGRIEGDAVYADTPYQDRYNNSAATAPAAHGGRPAQNGGYVGGGYVQAPPGSRAVDDYYAGPTRNPSTTYPPQQQQPRRQASGYAPSAHAPSTYSYNSPTAISSPPLPVAANQYASTTPQQNARDPYSNPGYEYGHTAGGTSYNAPTTHQQQPTSYSQYDSYASQPPQHTFNAESYNNTGLLASPPLPMASTNNTPYYSTHSSPQGHAHQPDRSYSVGGDGYGANSFPPLADPHSTSYFPNNAYTSAPGPTSPVRGPRPQSSSQDDEPPVYDAGHGVAASTGAWGKQ